MKKIKDHVYFENSYAGVTVGAMIFSNDTLLVDAPLKPEDARVWLADLRKAGANPRRLAINLDSHPDRTLGTQSLDAQVMAHDETARQFRKRAAIFKSVKQESGAEWEETPGLSGLRWVTPTVTFSEGATLHLDERELQVELHPGTGPGSCWLISPEDKVVFIGDAVVLGQPPFLAQADLDIWIKSLERLLTREFRDYAIISGRGGKITTRDIKDQVRLLNDVRSKLRKFSKRKNTAGAEIDKLALRLAEKFKSPAKKHSLYAQRLKYGLHHYYARQYLPATKSQNND